MPVLQRIQVRGSGPQPYTPKSLSSSKFTQPIADTTQTIVVLPRRLTEDQQALTLADAMKNVPGAGTFNLGENGATRMGDDIYLRGIDTANSIYVDGIRDTSTVHRDLFNTEAIDVILGPSGADFGRGAPSGSINMVSKQPTRQARFDASLGVGSARYKRGTLDWNQPLTPTAAFRVNVMGIKSGLQGRDKVRNDRTGVAPAFALGLGTPTRAYLDVLHVHQTNIPDPGVLTIGMPGWGSVPGYGYVGLAPKVDRNSYYGTDLDHDDATTDMVTLRLEHDMNGVTTLRNATRYARTKENYLVGAFIAKPGTYLTTPDPANRAGWTARRLANVKDVNDRIWSNQTNVTSNFHTGSIEHDISAGLEFSREMQNNHGIALRGVLPPVSVYAPDPAMPGLSTYRSGINTYARTDTVALYGFDTVKLTKRIEINGGARVDHYRTVYDSTASLHKQGNLLTWKAGVLYHLTRHGNVYVNVGVSEQPPGGSDFQLQAADVLNRVGADRVDFAPEKAKTAELGTKWRLFNKQLLVSATLFQTRISNDVEQNDDGTFSQFGQKRVQGVEFLAGGSLTRHWSANAGYTIEHAYIAKGASVTADGSRDLDYSPRHAFTLWTTYQFPHGLRLGGGASYMGHMSRHSSASNPPTPDTVPRYWVFNALAGYRVNRNLDLQLNVNNVFDRRYIASINKSGYRYYPGASRNVMLTATIHFK